MTPRHRPAAPKAEGDWASTYSGVRMRTHAVIQLPVLFLEKFEPTLWPPDKYLYCLLMYALGRPFASFSLFDTIDRVCEMSSTKKPHTFFPALVRLQSAGLLKVRTDVGADTLPDEPAYLPHALGVDGALRATLPAHRSVVQRWFTTGAASVDEAKRREWLEARFRLQYPQFFVAPSAGCFTALSAAQLATFVQNAATPTTMTASTL